MECPQLISNGATHPMRSAFWGEGNDPMTSDIKANPNPTQMSHQVFRRDRGPICDESVTGLGGGECHG